MIISKISLLLLMAANMHPLHLGLTTVEINDTTKKAAVLFKLDNESLKYAFLHNYLYEIHTENKILNEKDFTFITEYINSHFLLELNGEKVSLNFDRHEIIENEIYLFYNAEINFAFEYVLVRNLLLMDVNLNQMNVLIFKKGSFEKNFILNKDESAVNFCLTEEKSEK